MAPVAVNMFVWVGGWGVWNLVCVGTVATQVQRKAHQRSDSIQQFYCTQHTQHRGASVASEVWERERERERERSQLR